MGHGEGAAEVGIQGAHHAGMIGGGDQRHGEAMHLVGDGVVLLAEADQLDQLGFQRAHLVAQVEQLLLGDRDGAAAVRIGQRDQGQHLGILVEEFGMVVEVAGDVF
jgi:hypothetical protein